MANQVKIDLSVEDPGNSIQRRTDGARILNAELSKAQKLATGTQTGSKAINASESMSYGVARAAVGTGAEGRDFAKQAQGLGGLVHVYATFAANLFAVGAAFRALSDAADTTNMIKGIDQLGASSGVALGSLAKQMVRVTDGAISMREAMEATTKGGAAGLSSDQMMKMADVAKKASQALGISMPDAISRLSRGISKLEPELLDELGLYTKLGKSTEDYARSVGKTATSLTDFERRQAFANAVLKEGADKFSNIKIDANPYDKLLASIKNLGVEGLSVVNTVLEPLVKFLAQSPTALAGALALVGTTLLKQAIPAIGQYRQALQAATEQSLLRVSGKSTFAKQALEQRLAEAAREAELLANVQQTARDKATEKLQEISAQKFAQGKKRVGAILEKGIYDISQSDIDYLEKQAQKNISTNKVLATSYMEVANTIKSGKAAEAEYQRIEANRLKVQEDITNTSKKQRATDSEFNKLAQAAVVSQISAKAAANVKELGYIAALKAAYLDLFSTQSRTIQVPTGKYQTTTSAKGKQIPMLDELGNKIPELESVAVPVLSKVTASFGLLRAGISASVSAIGSLVSKIGDIAPYLGIAIGAFEMMDSWLSKNSEEVEKFNVSIIALHDAGKLVENVLANITKNSLGFLSVESIIARANAFKEVADSIEKSVTALDAADVKSGKWDRFIDGFKVAIGKDLRSTFTKEMSFTLAESIKAIPEGTARDNFVEKLGKVLDTTDLSFEGLQEAADKLPKEKFISTFKDITAEAKKLSLAGSAGATALKSVADGFTTLQTAYQNIVTSLAPSDLLSKFGSELVNQGIALGKAFEDPINAVAELKSLLNDTSKLALLPQASIDRVLALKDAVNATNSQLNTLKQEVESAKAELIAAQEQAKSSPSEGEDLATATRLAQAAQGVKTSEMALTAAVNKLADYGKEGAKLQADSIRKGMEYIQRAVTSAQGLARIGVSQTLMSGVEGVEAATRRGELAKEEIAIQRESITSMTNLTDSILQNTIQLDKANMLADRDYLAKKSINHPLSAEETVKLESLSKSLGDIDKVLDVLKGGKGVKTEDLGPGAVRYLAQREQQQAGAKAQLAGLAGKEKSAELAMQLDKQQQLFNLTQKMLKLEQDSATLNKQRTDLVESYLPFLSEEQILSKKSFEDKIAANSLESKTNELMQQEEDLRIRISRASGKDKEALEASLTIKEAINDKTLENLNTEDRIRQIRQKIFEIENKYTEARVKREESYAKEEQSLRIAEQQVSAQQELLSVKNSLSMITPVESESQRNALEIRTQEVSYAKQLLKLEDEKSNKLDEIARKTEAATAAGATEEELAALRARKTATEEFYATEKSLVIDTNAAKMEAINLNQSLSDRMKGYSDIVKNAFESMGDALVTFAQTGKLDFKSLVDSMLADLLRFEMRAQMTALYSSMGGLRGMLGMPTAPMAGSAVVTPGSSSFVGPMPQAKGGAWDYGVQAFAQGGMFTNSIVDSPTLFKFAQGTGLMGEAGPEAIMPLKRDSNGNLGVRAGQGGKVDVVVNNYSTAEATTKETTDSRGNRRIEVTVGDLTAKEIVRSGSTSQKAIQNTFGVSPQLIRR